MKRARYCFECGQVNGHFTGCPNDTEDEVPTPEPETPRQTPAKPLFPPFDYSTLTPTQLDNIARVICNNAEMHDPTP